MTILVGILCKDGVVIGSDSSATFAAGQFRTIEQETKKIDIVGDQIIIAGTGQIGLGQRFSSQIQEAYKAKKFTGQSPIEMAKTMCQYGQNDFVSTRVAQGQYGALVAFPATQKLNLCEFATTDFQPELKTDRLWYVSMGSAQPIVDPFLGLMRKVFWTKGQPIYQEGIFAVTWAIQHAIELNPGGVNGPLQIATLTHQNSGDTKAHLLESHELAEHINNVEGAIEHLRNYREMLSGKLNQNTPDIPKP